MSQPIYIPGEPGDELLRPVEAARVGGVSVKTLIRWEKAGKLTARRTLGGHRRYYRGEILALTGAPAGSGGGLGTPRVDEL